jgi:hypothetical protein
MSDYAMSTADADRIRSEFDNNIWPKITPVFGMPSDVDSNGRVNILIYDIQDGFSGGGYVAGYFDPNDLFANNHSEIFYIDSYPGIQYNSTNDVTRCYGTIAHEFQHMINFDARNDSYLLAEYAWLNEAFSGLAEYITGFGYQTWKLMRSFLTIPISLTCWATLNSRNYGGSYLFGRYLYEQFGTAAIKKMVQNIGYDGVFNVANVTGMDFNVVYNNWVIALCLSNTGLSYDPKYNFTTLDLRTNGFDGLKTYPDAVFSMGKNATAFFKPYCPVKIEWADQTSNSTLTLSDATPGASAGGAVIAALKTI